MTNWVVDIGNTKTAFAQVGNRELLLRVDTPTADLAIAELGFFEQGDSVTIASVVPNATTTLSERLNEVGASVRVLKSHEIPLENRYREIDKLGADRILASYAAHILYGKPAQKHAIVVMLGTATTFECVSKEGVYLGGAITLGIGSIIDAVHERTAQLPKVPLEVPRSAIGTSTMESLQSGIIHTELLGISQFVHRLAVEAFEGETPLLIATGGLAPFVHEHTQLFDRVDLDLVLKGMCLTLNPTD